MAQENELINLFYKDTSNSMVNRQIRVDQLNTAKLLIIFKVFRYWFCSTYWYIFFVLKRKPYKNVKHHMPKSLELNKDTLNLQRAIFLRALWIICFEPLIWSNVQRLPHSWMWHVTIDDFFVVINFLTSIIACAKG